MSEPTVLILGGGVGGVVAANELRRRLKERARVVLVDRNAQQSFAPSYLWAMTGARTLAAITRDLRRLERRGIEVIVGDVQEIDLARRAVTVAGRAVGYDWLIVALGAQLAPEAVPGLAQAHTFYHLAGAEQLRDALGSFTG